jgi:uncharacterized protein GlcG (DUF336 family)
MISLETAQRIIAAALAKGRELKLAPLGVAVLDIRGALKAYAEEDQTVLMRAQIAQGKAYGALALGFGARKVVQVSKDRPEFINSAVAASGGRIVAAVGGVLIRAKDGAVIGAVGVSGDTPDNDERAALAGIEACGLTPDAG